MAPVMSWFLARGYVSYRSAPAVNEDLDTPWMSLVVNAVGLPFDASIEDCHGLVVFCVRPRSTSDLDVVLVGHDFVAKVELGVRS